MAKSIITNCGNCRKEYRIFKNWFDRNPTHCCSRKCSDELKSKKCAKSCKNCNKKYFGKSHQGVSLFCSRICARKYYSGERSHYFNPNKDIDIRLMEDTNFKRWSKKIKERDNYVCKKCGCDKKDELQAHHIEMVSSNKLDRFTMSNGITLCIKCHANEHIDDNKLFKLILSHYKRLNYEINKKVDTIRSKSAA